MLTLTYAVIGYYFFGQVTTFSGFGGITGIDAPAFFHGHPMRLYYLRSRCRCSPTWRSGRSPRTPFGLALQGVRDDPVRMASLGFNVPLHRTLAFTLAGFVAGVAGVLNIWWNGQIDPTSISIGPTIDLLIIAVIGGIVHLEGAWLGAFVFVVANNYMRDMPLDRPDRRRARDRVAAERFNTVIGVLVLLIMVLSPDGLVGVIVRARDCDPRVLRRGPPDDAVDASPPAEHARRSDHRRDADHAHRHRSTITTTNTPTRGTTMKSTSRRAFGALFALGARRGRMRQRRLDDDGGESEAPTAQRCRRHRAEDDRRHRRTDGRTTRHRGRGPTTAPRRGRAASSSASSASARAPFGGFHEDVVAGATLAMVNDGGATSNSTDHRARRLHRRQGGRLDIELVGIGCGDDTADRIIQEVRTLVEQDGAEVVIGPLSGDEGIAVANYARDHPEVTFIDGIAGAQDTTLKVQAPNYFRFHGDGAQWNAGLGDTLHNEAGWDTVAVIADDYSFGWTSAAGFIADFCAVGGDVVTRVFPPLGTTDYSSFVAAAARTPTRSTATSGSSAAPAPTPRSRRS